MSVPLSPIPLSSLLPPLIPHLLSSSLFSSVYFSSHDSSLMASSDPFIKRITPSSSQLNSFVFSQVANQHYETLPAHIFPLWSEPPAAAETCW